MKRVLVLGGLSLVLAGFPALARANASPEAAPEGTVAPPETTAKPLSYVDVPVNLDGVDYLARIDISGAAPMIVNGVDLDVSEHLPGAVRIARADGATMADEGYRARDVLAAACATQGLGVAPGVVPVLSPAGRWIFPGGCK